jgi:predicted transcriptional regulator
MKRLASGELEWRVLEILWQRDEWMTPAEVHALIRRSPPLAYTTVMTVLVRLHDKGMVTRRREGRGFVYSTVATRDEWTAQRMSEVLASAGDRDAALGHFVGELDRVELDRLRAILRRRR